MKELLLPRVKADIDGLRFNSEEYTPAKNILMNNYGKPREVANAHIQCIMGLPVITETNPTRINESYEKLITNVQTLESMGKDKDIRGYVRLTLDKLQGIRADLVRLDDNWQEWRFPKLAVALKNGCECPWMATMGDVTREQDPLFQAKQEGGSIAVMFTVSLRNINQLTVTTLKG